MNAPGPTRGNRQAPVIMPDGTLIEELVWAGDAARLQRAFGNRTPVVVRGLAASLPVLGGWNLGRLASAYGETVVPVSTRERDPRAFPAWVGDSPQPFSAFAAAVEDPAQRVYVEAIGLTAALTAELGKPKFMQERSWEPLLWIGSAWTETPLHIDWWHNLLVVLEGSKEVGMLPPSASVRAVPWYRSKRFHSNTFAMEYRDPVPMIRLDPGDGVYLPPGWWHKVRNPTRAVALTNFWEDRRLALRRRLLKGVGRLLRI